MSNWFFDDMPINFDAEFTKMVDEFGEDMLRDAFGLRPKNRQNQQSQYTTHSKVAELPEDPQERWSQHLDRIRRGKRLTGDGREIVEERP